jgi:hypothetical protein
MESAATAALADGSYTASRVVGGFSMTPGGFWFGFGVVTGLLLYPWLAQLVTTIKLQWAKLEASQGDRDRQADPDDFDRR